MLYFRVFNVIFDLQALFKAGRIETVNEKRFGKQFYSLIGLDLYDEMVGLSWEVNVFIKAEKFSILKKIKFLLTRRKIK